MPSGRWTWWKSAVLCTYIVFLAIAIRRHEPWFDEAQAWLLARDASVYDLVTKYLRYEGSPGLWHYLLVLPSKAGLPYASMGLLSGLAAVVSVYLFLRYSPFPTVVKLLYPFSFFAFYQYAVVARSYVLIPLLLFLLAVIYKDRMERPHVYALLLLLLANVSMHGLLIASGLAFKHLLDLLKAWRHTGSAVRKNFILSYGVFTAVIVLVCLQLMPPPDLISLASFKLDTSVLFPKGLSMFSDALVTNLALPAADGNILHTLSQLAANIIILVTLLWLGIRKRLSEFIFPLICLVLLFAAVYSNVWHQGSLFFLWLFILWVSYGDGHDGVKNPLGKAARSLITLCLTAVLCVQSYWSYDSFIYDYQNSYSASRELASYLKQNRLDQKKIYIDSFYPVSVLPYFETNLFCNYNEGKKPCFWFWSSQNSMYKEPFSLYTSYAPDVIILSLERFSPSGPPDPSPALPEIPGYRLHKLFEGGLYWKDRIYEKDSYALFEKEPR